MARYTFDQIKGWKPIAQAAFVYQTEAHAGAARRPTCNIIGVMPAYGLLDLSGGIEKQWDRTSS